MLLFTLLCFGREVHGILDPQQGTEPAPPALECKILTTGPPGKSLKHTMLSVKIYAAKGTFTHVGISPYLSGREK